MGGYVYQLLVNPSCIDEMLFINGVTTGILVGCPMPVLFYSLHACVKRDIAYTFS